MNCTTFLTLTLALAVAIVASLVSAGALDSLVPQFNAPAHTKSEGTEQFVNLGNIKKEDGKEVTQLEIQNNNAEAKTTGFFGRIRSFFRGGVDKAKKHGQAIKLELPKGVLPELNPKESEKKPAPAPAPAEPAPAEPAPAEPAPAEPAPAE